MKSLFQTEPIQNSALLHSLANFGEVFASLLLAFKPRSVCEIGIEHGTASNCLMEICARMDAQYIGVDPTLSSDLRKALAAPGREFHLEKSHRFLRSAPAFECYIIDGDHNYYTVFEELKLISEAAERDQSRPPLIILHDTWWPCGFRDFYYDPSDIPEEHRHDYHQTHGPVPDQAGLDPAGFRGHGSFFAANQEGGPANGVLAAVEDWLSLHPAYHRIDVPAIFGVTILGQPEAGWGNSACDQWTFLQRTLELLGPLLARMEINRVRNYSTILRKDYEHEADPKLGSPLNRKIKAQMEKNQQLRSKIESISNRFTKQKIKLQRMERFWGWKVFARPFWKLSKQRPGEAS